MGFKHGFSRSSKPSRVPLAAFCVVLIAILIIGAIQIGRTRQIPLSNRAAPATQVKEPRVVSLLPQATEILVSMGCADHLVAVSNFDNTPEVAGLPRVGDYQTTDWETIVSLHPAWIITHYGAGKTPAGFVQRADSIGARQLNLMTETLDGPDANSTIYGAIALLGKTCNEPAKASAAEALLRSRIRAVQDRVKGEDVVPTLIVIGAEGTLVAGRETFLNELLELAGGTNVADRLAGRYPNIDREEIQSLKPEVILQLLPNAEPQVIRQAASFWTGLTDVPAVSNNRVVQLKEWYELLPGYHVADIAEQFAQALHPGSAKKGPAVQP